MCFPIMVSAGKGRVNDGPCNRNLSGEIETYEPGFCTSQRKGTPVNEKVFLLLNLALSFYLVGAIWAIEVDIFRSWKLIDSKDFHMVQSVHWRKLPYWVFAPLAVALMGSVTLIWYRPENSPGWAIWGNLCCQLASHVLTAMSWGRWQAELSKDPSGPDSLYLAKILATHWIRTLLINLYGFVLLAWAIRVLA